MTAAPPPDKALQSDKVAQEQESRMQQAIAHVALVVRDYDEAISFYVSKLGFRLVEDTARPEQNKRWVVVAPPGASGTTLLLARASTPEQSAFIGNQSGGRVFLFLQTDNFWRDYKRFVAAGVEFVRAPSKESYGIVAVFQDLYGNRWDLLQYSRSTPYALTVDPARLALPPRATSAERG